MSDYWDWGGAGKGAATGASAGAAAGPWGALVGGLIGTGFGGLFSNVPGKRVKPPDTSNWDALIGQLQQKAAGNGRSLAGEAYKSAQQTGMNNVLAMSRGGSAGAARQGIQTLGEQNQGLAKGYADAKLAEQNVYQQQLQSALVGRDAAMGMGNAENRAQANDALAAQQREMATYAQLAQAGATAYGAYQNKQATEEAAKKAAEDEARKRRGGY